MTIRFDGKVAIVTGAGAGLGRSHALALAARGAKVVVNDLGGARDGSGGSVTAAQAVVEEIRAAGGEAMANGANVAVFAEVQQMVEQAMSAWGRVDILVNNAGILRDKSFSKMTLEDFRAVMDVHLFGAVHCTKAVWEIMRAQQYGRIVMTTSSSGLYGNFGQANYGAAKMAVVGLMNTLVLEGEKYGIRVNALAPAAGTRMTEGLFDQKVFDLLTPEAVTAGLLVLCAEQSPNRLILAAGAGGYASAHIYETQGVHLMAADQTPENVLAALDQIKGRAGQEEYTGGFQQSFKFVGTAAKALGIDARERHFEPRGIWSFRALDGEVPPADRGGPRRRLRRRLRAGGADGGRRRRPRVAAGHNGDAGSDHETQGERAAESLVAHERDVTPVPCQRSSLLRSSARAGPRSATRSSSNLRCMPRLGDLRPGQELLHRHDCRHALLPIHAKEPLRPGLLTPEPDRAVFRSGEREVAPEPVGLDARESDRLRRRLVEAGDAGTELPQSLFPADECAGSPADDEVAAVAPGLDLDRIGDARDRLRRRLTGVGGVAVQAVAEAGLRVDSPGPHTPIARDGGRRPGRGGNRHHVLQRQFRGTLRFWCHVTESEESAVVLSPSNRTAIFRQGESHRRGAGDMRDVLEAWHRRRLRHTGVHRATPGEERREFARRVPCHRP